MDFPFAKKKWFRKFSFALAILLIAVISFPNVAQAGLFDWVLGAVGDDIAKLVVSGIGVTFGLVFFVVSAVTNWLIDATINVGVLPGKEGTPIFVQAGWEFSRQFVNMLFLVILVFIGLATILRLQEYQLQRTLPKLILIALLVNFSAVLVGFVVDIGNLFTHFFLESIGDLGSNTFSTIWTNSRGTIDSIFDANEDKVSAFVSALSFALVLAFFFLFAILAYLALAVIFFLRLIVLWTLVILAPFAFACYILPATRSWWSRWFGALTQWAFVGVPIAFFMWLANIVLLHPVLDTTDFVVTGSAGVFRSLLVDIVSPFAAIALLLGGMGFALSMAPGATQGILKKASLGDAWRSKAGSKFKGRAAGIANKYVVGALPGGLGNLSTKLQEGGEKAKNPLARWAMQTTGGRFGLGGAATATGKVAGFAERPLMEYEQKQRQLSLPAGFAKWGPERQAKWISSLMFASDRVQAGKVISDAGNLQFTSEGYKKQHKKDVDWARDRRDDFYQEEIYSADRAFPEDLAESENLQWTLQKSKVPKGLSRKILQAFDEKKAKEVVRDAALAEREKRGETLTKEEIASKGAVEEISEKEFEDLGVKNESQRKRLKQAIQEARKKNSEARAVIAQALKKDEDGNDIHVGIDIEYGIKHKLITRDLANTDRVKAVQDVRDQLTKTNKMEVYEEKDRDRFLRDSAASMVFVRDERSQYIKNIADITGDDLGTRMGLASNPEHLRQVQQNFSRGAVSDIFGGAGGINDQTSSLEKLKAFAKRNPAMHNFLLNNPLGREFPYEGRSYMDDVYDRPTSNPGAFRDTLRVSDLIEKDKRTNNMYLTLKALRSEQEQIAQSEIELRKANDDLRAFEGRTDLIDAEVEGKARLEEVRETLSESLDKARKRHEEHEYVLKTTRDSMLRDPGVTPSLRRDVQELEIIMGKGQRGGRGRGNRQQGGRQDRNTRRGRGPNNLNDMGNPIIPLGGNRGSDNLDDMGNPPPPRDGGPDDDGSGGETGGATPISTPQGPRPSAGPATRAPRTTEETERRSPGRTQTENTRQRQAEQLRTDPGFRQRFLEQLARHQSLDHAPQVAEMEAQLKEVFGPNYEDVIPRLDLAEGREPEVSPPNSRNAPRKKK